MTDRDLMKQALRVIKQLVVDESDDAPALQGSRMRKLGIEKALNERLAQPEQEPLGYVHLEEVQMLRLVDGMRARLSKMPDWPCTQPIYTTPLKREWIGLTEQEAAECWSTSAVRTWQAIEDKLKEKNT